MSNLCVLIMAGGKGTRFWPMSTEEKPKQFLNLIGEETMIQMTINRVRGFVPIDKIFICTGKRYVDIVREQVPDLLKRNIIIEPESRNTAPCIALSAMVINRYYKDATMVVLPADHLISKEEVFTNIIRAAMKFVNKTRGSIVTFGMKPSRPEIGYGYIKCSNVVKSVNGYRVNKVETFVEKPNYEKATEYVADERYLWNGGMFLWRVEDIISKIKVYLPKTYEALCKIQDVNEMFLQDEINNSYSKTDIISVDYGILEKDNEIYVIPSEIGWDDIGTWKAIERYKKKDEFENIITNGVTVIESRSNMAINKEKKVVMIGVEDLMTLETEDTFYVVNKDYMDNLRDYQNII